MRKHGIASACFVAALLLSLSCCTFLYGPLPGSAAESPAVQHVPYTGTFSYTVDPGATAHDVYFVFTNPSITQDSSQKPSVTTSVVSVDGVTLPEPGPQPLPSHASAPQSRMDRIAEFNRNAKAYLPQLALTPPSASVVSPAGSDHVGLTGTFYTSSDKSAPVSATCQAYVGPVTFSDGRTRTLSIWVDDTAWTTEVNPTMVAALAARFLQSPESLSDIYHWDTAVVGEPWGPQSSSSYITWDTNSTITILLTHLNTSYTGGSVTVGYFWAKDNFAASAVPGSNERIMFYIDSKLYSSLKVSESSWAATNYWPMFVFSTLAHEFQHMIQFYQKQVVYGLQVSTDTWINEMCSMLMEDLVADKLGVNGPRGLSNADGSAGSPGITDGRIPSFLQNSFLPLAQKTTFDLADYSTAYAFGSWLARNYGGAALLQRIVQCAQTDETAVVNAAAAASGRTDESMARLLEKWAAAVLISDTTSAPAGYAYNTGGWIKSSFGGVDYNLGSINIFNYSPSLNVFTGSGPVPSASFSPASNIYYRAAKGLSAARTWTVSVPAGVEMSVVLK